jgi:hypothetical protein
MQIVEVSPEQADGWAQHSAWMAQAAAVLESATCRAFPNFAEIADEWTQGWLAPLEVAKQRNTALYSDDAVVRALAQSVGVPTFGTVALVAALVADGRFSSADQDATILELRRARVVDLLFDERQLLAIAEADQWVPGPVYLAMSRPALWQHGTRALDFYRMGTRRVAAINADYLPEWLFVGVLGFGRLPQADDLTGAAELLLSTTALEVGLDPTIFARLVQAARRASVQIGGNDPLPKSANDIIEVFVQALGPAGGVRFVLHVFSGLEPVDRLIAVREVLKTDRKQE